MKGTNLGFSHAAAGGKGQLLKQTRRQRRRFCCVLESTAAQPRPISQQSRKRDLFRRLVELQSRTWDRFFICQSDSCSPS